MRVRATGGWYEAGLMESGRDAPTRERQLAQAALWRNVYVAETDAEAERIAVPAFIEMHEHRVAMRNRIYAEQKASILPMPCCWQQQMPWRMPP